MSALQAVLPPRIRRRWDAAALAQLVQFASDQADELVRLRIELAHADDAAEFWREQAMELQQQLADLTGGAPGIKQTGQLIIAKPEGRA